MLGNSRYNKQFSNLMINIRIELLIKYIRFLLICANKIN